MGDETHLVDDIGDITTEDAIEGTDTVQASVTLTLGPNVENIVQTGTGVINGTGDGDANSITGNAKANILSGLAATTRCRVWRATTCSTAARAANR